MQAPSVQVPPPGLDEVLARLQQGDRAAPAALQAWVATAAATADAHTWVGWIGEAALRRSDATFALATAATAIESYDAWRRQREQAWLRFLVHELKNAINTLLNTVWLLREQTVASSTANAGRRFLDIAERALRTLESRVADVRNLHELAQSQPPPREPRLVRTVPPAT